MIMSKANKELQDKQTYIKKKFYHLKTSNLGEKEYRMKEKALQHSEVTDINEIKEDLFKKLSSLKIQGFKSKEELLQERIEQLSLQGIKIDPSKKYELEERSFLVYKKNQMNLLDTLLKADYSTQPQPKPNPRMEAKKDLQPPQRKGPYIPSLARREKKPTIVKLSKILKTELSKFEQDESYQSNPSISFKTEDVHRVSTSEIKKINEVRSDKTYYDEAEIEETYRTTKKFLTDLRSSNDFQVENLDNEKLGQLVDAVSFSLNGVHYYQKMKKSKSMIHPIDILYILSKFR